MNPPQSSDSTAPPFRRAGVTDHVTELFHEEIRSGRWVVGSKIPVESELVRWTGAGRNSVREAVQSLVQAGLVRREQGRGTFVISRSPLTQTLSRRLGTAERRDALELRRTIDTATAALAAERRSDADVAELERLLDARARSWRQADLALRIATDTALHRAVAAATHNELFVELYEGLLGLFETVLHADVQGDTDPHAALHEQLVRAIAAGDPAAASGAIERLLEPLITP
ncbi:MAG: FCD domain-containing protein [Herbiconiux sp.]|nr:FCD domain-containing protein [Herbiconiux sp.]